MQGLSSTKHRQLLYKAGGLREDLRLLEVDESMLKHIAEAGYGALSGRIKCMAPISAGVLIAQPLG